MAWHDDPLPKFFSDLIRDLRDEVWRLKGEGNVARTSTVVREISEDGTAREAVCRGFVTAGVTMR